MVENVYIRKSQACKALIEACKQVFTAAPVSIRAVPHLVSGFRADDQLVSIWHEIFLYNPSQIFLSTSRLRSIIVGKVKVRDAIVKAVKHSFRIVS